MPDQANEAEIRAILDNLQEEIRRHRQALGELGFFTPPDPLRTVRERQWVNSHLPIGWPVMPKGIIPKLIAYAQKITRRLLRWYINPLVDQQNAYNAAVSEALAGIHAQLNQLDVLSSRLTAVENSLRSLAGIKEQINALEQTLANESKIGFERNEALRTHFDEIESRLATHFQEIDTHLTQLQKHADDQDAWMHDLEQRSDHLSRALDVERSTRESQEETTRLRLQRLENWYRRLDIPKNVNSPPVPRDRTADTFDYYLLGARWRNVAQVSARLSDYDDLFLSLLQAGSSLANAPVLDLGAGRGELVEHLAELGLHAYGIDIDADAVSAARDAGRDVRMEEGHAHLASLSDNSLAALVMVQVIEHLDVEPLLDLLRLGHRKLLPGGLLVAETINPTCLWALSNWYLLDPSHKTPLHPEMTRFLLEQVGFGQIEIRYLHPVKPEEQLELPKGEAIAQRNIEQLNRFLYGPQDYAAIARKVGEE
ncbi:MAG: methyltransferase domain-containing protein [Chloroflexi bacterium]|nr:methyltransferase domain-containing protein [Chloroflexota bacterium]